MQLNGALYANRLLNVTPVIAVCLSTLIFPAYYPSSLFFVVSNAGIVTQAKKCEVSHRQATDRWCHANAKAVNSVINFQISAKSPPLANSARKELLRFRNVLSLLSLLLLLFKPTTWNETRLTSPDNSYKSDCVVHANARLWRRRRYTTHALLADIWNQTERALTRKICDGSRSRRSIIER